MRQSEIRRLGKVDGVPQPSVANLDDIHVVPMGLLGSRLGMLPANLVREVKRALGYALDWPELKVL